MFPCSRGCGATYGYHRNLVRHEVYECPLLPPLPSRLQVTGPRRDDGPPSRRRLPPSLPPPLPPPSPGSLKLYPSLHLGPLFPPVTTPVMATGKKTSLVPPTLAAPSPNLLPPPYPTPPTSLCQYPPSSPTTYQYSTPPLTPYQYPTPPSTPYQYPTPPSTPYKYPTPPSTPYQYPTIPSTPYQYPTLPPTPYQFTFVKT